MRNLRLVVAYDGAPYSGWQVQPAVPTVQGAIEQALAQMTREPCRLRGAGRTDAGVHAQGQVASFRTAAEISCERFLKGLNALTPDSITIRAVDEVDPEFDPRRDNHGKHYRYTIWRAQVIPPDVRRIAWHVRRTLDLPALASAARQLVGTHDFAAFRAAGCERETTVRTLYRCTVGAEGDRVTIDVEGTAFLKHMVRIIVGTLVEVSSHQLAPDAPTALLSHGDRTRGGVTAPASGLCLVRVFLR